MQKDNQHIFLELIITTIDAQGKIEKKLVGVDYDVINDFRENKSVTHASGIDTNCAVLPIGIVIIPFPVPLPSYNRHETQSRTAVTTKVIHTSGILEEKVAYDLGARVSTKNLAWDAETGEVLLTETQNEYNDTYYSFNYPAYWAYPGMAQASRNLSLSLNLDTESNNVFRLKDYSNPASDYLIDGDEVWLTRTVNEEGFNSVKSHKAWVVLEGAPIGRLKIIDRQGLIIPTQETFDVSIKVGRSGHRNMQMTNMGAVTLMTNPLLNSSNIPLSQLPLDLFTSSAANDKKIVNASAVEYSDVWPAQCECELPKMAFAADGKLKHEFNSTSNINDDPIDILSRSYNPYVWNVLGSWRANKSYAYLTGRNFTADATPRSTGFFIDFVPFYRYVGAGATRKMVMNVPSVIDEKWTFASEVSQINPFGQEVENRDALDRYSSALFGYNNRFPVAVASNTEYKELGFDGFEDYGYTACKKTSHFNFYDLLKLNVIDISTKFAHTGKNSLKIKQGVRDENNNVTPAKAQLLKQIISCATDTLGSRVATPRKKANTIKK
jgi:hypothetical protein